MTASIIVAVGALVFGWSIVSGALSRRNITGPLLFAAAGYLLCNPDWGPLTIDIETASIHVVAEVTLALVLFSDAARVNVTELRSDMGLPVRLLGIGLLLSVVLGALSASLLFPDIPWGLAGFLGAALAPTDAALSIQVIEDQRIPMRLRRALNVESGLNDGIATPIVSVMLAVAASQLGLVDESPTIEAGAALRELGAGLLVGLALGIGGAVLINLAARRGWMAGGSRRLATLALALTAFELALAVEGNGFIAAFVAGIAFGATLDSSVTDLERAAELPELGGELLALVVWFLFGAALLPLAFEHLDGRMALYALLSLTLIRMVPVILSLFRSGLDRPSVTFIAWFGPRGLASVVFGLLAIEELGEGSVPAEQAVGAVSLTVLLSIVLHGFTAGPGGRRYVQHEQAVQAVRPPTSRGPDRRASCPATIRRDRSERPHKGAGRAPSPAGGGPGRDRLLADRRRRDAPDPSRRTGRPRRCRVLGELLGQTDPGRLGAGPAPLRRHRLPVVHRCHP